MTPRIRADFPLLDRTVEGKPVTYLDSAATSLKPRVVMDAERRYGEFYSANVFRGVHLLSEEASGKFEDSRRRVADFLGAESREIVFVKNATEGINLLANGLGLARADRVAAFTSEHHSNLAPWMRAATIQWIDAPEVASPDLDLVRTRLRKSRPAVLAFAQVNNVTGATLPAAELCSIAAEQNIVTVVDASQSIAHAPIDVRDLGCDFLVFSAHKILGPTGIGVLYGRYDRLRTLEPLVVGGGSVETVTREGYVLRPPPAGLEAGTPNISGALGLAAALDYLDAIGRDRISQHARELAKQLRACCRSVPQLEVIAGGSKSDVPIISFRTLSSALTPDLLAAALSDTYGIMVRSGFHCAQPLHQAAGFDRGSVRASAHVYTTSNEIDYLAESLRELTRRLAG